jgi:hypothetical protein
MPSGSHGRGAVPRGEVPICSAYSTLMGCIPADRHGGAASGIDFTPVQRENVKRTGPFRVIDQ